MSMLDLIHFKNCPRCGTQHLQPNDMKSFVCMSCGFIYHHSPAPAAAGIIQYHDQIILTKRAREPKKGMITIPGGFLEYEESFENGLARELQEELNLKITAPEYLCSYWGKYLYRDVVYFTTIAYFIIRIEDLSVVKPNDDVEDFVLVRPCEVDPGRLAFEGDRVALNRYQGR